MACSESIKGMLQVSRQPKHNTGQHVNKLNFRLGKYWSFKAWHVDTKMVPTEGVSHPSTLVLRRHISSNAIYNRLSLVPSCRHSRVAVAHLKKRNNDFWLEDFSQGGP